MAFPKEHGQVDNMARRRGYWAQLEELYRQNRRLFLLVSAIAFVIGFVGGSLFMLQQATAAVSA